MYVRFFRWASDRIEDNGIVAFVSNSSFIHRRVADGFRKLISDEFRDVYLIDLGGDVRSDPRLSGTRNNVFGIQTGVAISFLVKRSGGKGCRIHYARRPQLETAEEKLVFLGNTSANAVSFSEIMADPRHDWLRVSSDEFDALLQVADRDTKSTRITSQERSIFKQFSLGIATNRDDWVYDFNREALAAKVRYFMSVYNSEMQRWMTSGRPKAIGSWVTREIKWTSELEDHLTRGTPLDFELRHIRLGVYRPFSPRYVYYDRVVVHRL